MTFLALYKPTAESARERIETCNELRNINAKEGGQEHTSETVAFVAA